MFRTSEYITNPVTGHPIKVDGPTFNKMMKGLVESKSGYTTNPQTGRAIKVGGPTYNKLVKMYFESKSKYIQVSPKCLIEPEYIPIKEESPQKRKPTGYNNFVKEFMPEFKGFPAPERMYMIAVAWGDLSPEMKKLWNVSVQR